MVKLTLSPEDFKNYEVNDLRIGLLKELLIPNSNLNNKNSIHYKLCSNRKEDLIILYTVRLSNAKKKVSGTTDQDFVYDELSIMENWEDWIKKNDLDNPYKIIVRRYIELLKQKVHDDSVKENKKKKISKETRKLSEVWVDKSFKSCINILTSGDAFEAIITHDKKKDTYKFIGKRRGKNNGLRLYDAWIKAIRAKGKLSASFTEIQIQELSNNQFRGLDIGVRTFDLRKSDGHFPQLVELIKATIT